MSVTLTWQPVGKDFPLPRGNNSYGTLEDKLRRVFGNLPLTLTKDDIPQLEVLAKLEEDTPETDNPFTFLIRQIREVDAIRINASY